MSLIYLMRHGETDAVGRRITSWLPGVPINERGMAQAERLAERLAGVPFSALYSSPLERARMTAGPLARATGLEIRDCPDIGEFRFGDWTGRTLADLEQDPTWKEFNRFRSRVRAPGGELMLEVQTRMVTALEGMRERHPGQTVAAFSHADAIRAAVLHYLGMPVDFIDRIEIQPASVTILQLEDWGSRVVTLNWPEAG